jgi:hypothetical protein
MADVLADFSGPTQGILDASGHFQDLINILDDIGGMEIVI